MAKPKMVSSTPAERPASAHRNMTAIRRELRQVKAGAARQAARQRYVESGALPPFPTPRRDASVPKKTWHRAGGTRKYVPKGKRGAPSTPSKGK